MSTLGDRCKKAERIETEQRFIKDVPLYVRIDGRGFSKFTKGMKRPFDADMSYIMMETTKALMQGFNCSVGYCQSDEISLVISGKEEDVLFDYKKQKLVSSMAALASSKFTYLAMKYFSDRVEKDVPTFDCRIINATKNDVVEHILFRTRDAVKNSYSMAAHTYYSNGELFEKTSAEKRVMLKEKGIDFDDYPLYFREGTFFKKVKVERTIPDEIWDKIPERNRPDSRTFIRTEIQDCNIEDFESMPNKVKFIFDKYFDK